MTPHPFTRFAVLSLAFGTPAALLLVCVLLEFQVPLNREGAWAMGFWNGRVRVSNWPQVEASNRRADAYAKEYWNRWRHHTDDGPGGRDGVPVRPPFTPPRRVKPQGWSLNLTLPIAVPASLSLTFFLLHRRVLNIRRRRRRAGQCPECGYDLRASPERCPECGAPARPRSAVIADLENHHPESDDDDNDDRHVTHPSPADRAGGSPRPDTPATPAARV
jgi:hypothetical protein